MLEYDKCAWRCNKIFLLLLRLLDCREEVQIQRDEKRQRLDRHYDDLMLRSHSLFGSLWRFFCLR